MLNQVCDRDKILREYHNRGINVLFYVRKQMIVAGECRKKKRCRKELLAITSGIMVMSCFEIYWRV